MIRFTPFDFPFLAAPSQAGDTFAFAFEFRSPQQTSVSGGEYVINHGGFGIDQAGTVFIIRGGYSGPPARGIFPPQDMIDGLSCSMLNTHGLFFNVAGFSALGLDANSNSLVTHGKFEASLLGAVQDSGGALVQFRGGLYIISPDVLFRDDEFVPNVSSIAKSHGIFIHILNSVSSQESGSSIVFTVRGKYEEKEGVDVRCGLGSSYIVQGFFLESVGSILDENIPGAGIGVSKGEYRDGRDVPNLNAQNINRIGPSRGMFMLPGDLLVDEDGDYIPDEDGDPIPI